MSLLASVAVVVELVPKIKHSQSFFYFRACDQSQKLIPLLVETVELVLVVEVVVLVVVADVVVVFVTDVVVVFDTDVVVVFVAVDVVPIQYI